MHNRFNVWRAAIVALVQEDRRRRRLLRALTGFAAHGATVNVRSALQMWRSAIALTSKTMKMQRVIQVGSSGTVVAAVAAPAATTPLLKCSILTPLLKCSILNPLLCRHSSCAVGYRTMSAPWASGLPKHSKAGRHSR
jgi:hypothetical protein